MFINQFFINIYYIIIYYMLSQEKLRIRIPTPKENVEEIEEKSKDKSYLQNIFYYLFCFTHIK